MHFTFEFQCPEFSGFQSLASTEPANWHTDHSNPNDRWFLAQHNEQQYPEPLCPNQPQEHLPLVRTSPKAQSQRIDDLDIHQEQPTRSEAQQVNHQPPNQMAIKIKARKKQAFKRGNILADKRKNDKKERFQKEDHFAVGSKIKTQKPNDIATRSKSGLSKRNLSKGPWPCPFSTKIQREWEHAHGTKWYDLSPASKDEALKSMKKRDQSQSRVTTKSSRGHSNDK